MIKTLNSRIIHKHDTEENWLKATGFTPEKGEIIVYDIDATYNYERFKIGDGKSNVNTLPFADETKANIEHSHNDIYYTETEVDTKFSELVGTKPVSEQIGIAMENVAIIDSEDNDIEVNPDVTEYALKSELTALAARLTVDTGLSDTSANPVRNSVITKKFNEIYGLIDDLRMTIGEMNGNYYDGNYSDGNEVEY